MQTIYPTSIPTPIRMTFILPSLSIDTFLNIPIIMTAKMKPIIYPPVIPVSVFGRNFTIPLEKPENTGTPIIPSNI